MATRWDKRPGLWFGWRARLFSLDAPVRGGGGWCCFFRPGCSSPGRLPATCPQMIHSGWRRLLLFVPPRMIPSGASTRHLSPDDPIRGAEARVACSAPDDPLRAIWSLAQPLAWSSLRCFFSALSGSPPLCLFTGSTGGKGASWWPPLAWLGVAWHRLPCRACVCAVRAVRVCGTGRRLLLGTGSCAVVVAGGVPLWRAFWPRVGATRLVRSGRSRCSGPFSRRRGAFPQPGGSRPRFYWAAARGTWRSAKNRAHCACR